MGKRLSPCPHADCAQSAECGSRLVYRDEDGQGCTVCGWHSWPRAQDRVRLDFEIPRDERSPWQRTVEGEKRSIGGE